MKRTILFVVLSAALAVGAAADDPAGPSHLNARMAVEALSHLGAHRPGLPPEALLVPLGNGADGVLKGMTLAEEEQLVRALQHRPLHQTLLRVGAAEAAGRRMAIIKLQAGADAGDFCLAHLRSDAALCMRAVFNVALGFDHLDLWSVVPGAALVGDEQEHLPVFSLSVAREQYLAASRGGGNGPEIVNRLDAVRYSPVFLRYALDAGDARGLPASAITAAPWSESWDDLRAEAREARGTIHAQTEVSAIFSGARDCRRVALTIDDGPHPLITPLVLAVLRAADVKATFFVVGQKVEEFPALARMIADEGHELANHTYSHRRLHELADDDAWAEVAACRRVVEHMVGAPTRFFRPPGGRCSPGGLQAVGSLGYTAAFWSRNTGDWRKPSAAQIVHEATGGLEPGDVILMHQGDLCSVEALPGIIARVREMGLEPTTLARVADGGGIISGDPTAISTMVNGQLGEE